jgi:CxxC-x17-CxxC domain-containing protein
MRDFNRDRNSRNRKSGGFGGRDSHRNTNFRGGKSEMHKAVCAECGVVCEVPFKPRGDKPVYCSNCFADRENLNSRGSSGRDFFKSKDSHNREREMFKVVCDECGKDCEVPFKPSPDKPVYCDECFGKGGNSRKSFENNNSLDKQFELLNSKLDRLIDILTLKNNVIKLSNNNDKKSEVKKTDDNDNKKKITKKDVKKIISKPNKKEVKKEVKKVETNKKTVSPKKKTVSSEKKNVKKTKK